MTRCLIELDIPGASLIGRRPQDLTIPQLKRWLQCQNASLKMEKADFCCEVSSVYGIYGSIRRHRHGPAFSHNIIDRSV